MDDTGPISWFVLFAMLQAVPLALALGVLLLAKLGRGGWDLKDWAAGLAAVVAAVALIMGSHDIRAVYIDYVGKDATGTVTRKWLSEGDDSTTFKIAVQLNGYVEECDVSEGVYDSLNPPQPTPVRWDPDYPAEFIPKFRIARAWAPLGVVPMVAVAMLLELFVFTWVFARLIDRFRKPKQAT